MTWGWVLWARNEQGVVHWYVGDLWENEALWLVWVGDRGKREGGDVEAWVVCLLAVRVGLDLRPPATHTSHQ